MKRNMIYQKENIFLTNFTYRKKYDYLLLQHLTTIFEEYHQGKSRQSRNNYVKQALNEKLSREDQEVFFEIPKKLYVPFPKGCNFKVQFTISVNRITENTLYCRIKKLQETGICVLDYIREAIYEKMMQDDVLSQDDNFRLTLVLKGQEDSELIDFLRSYHSVEAQKAFIKQSLKQSVAMLKGYPNLEKKTS